MWSRTVLGHDMLLLMECFIIYSMLGWLVESIYMSFCEKKLTNRGFCTTPFCPIYGFGGVVGYLLLHSLEDNVVMLYIAGAIVATVFEFLVAQLMLVVFGKVWWDYNEKPYNYKGIICLESTIAWGFYAVIIIRHLNGIVVSAAEMIPRRIGVVMTTIITFVYLFDFVYHVLDALDISVRESRRKLVNNVREYIRSRR